MAASMGKTLRAITVKTNLPKRRHELRQVKWQELPRSFQWFLADMYYGPGSVSEYFESDPNLDPHTNGFWAKELVSAETNEHTATQSQRQQYRQQPSKASSSAGSSNDGIPRGSVGLMMMQDTPIAWLNFCIFTPLNLPD